MYIQVCSQHWITFSSLNDSVHFDSFRDVKVSHVASISHSTPFLNRNIGRCMYRGPSLYDTNHEKERGDCQENGSNVDRPRCVDRSESGSLENTCCLKMFVKISEIVNCRIELKMTEVQPPQRARGTRVEKKGRFTITEIIPGSPHSPAAASALHGDSSETSLVAGRALNQAFVDSLVVAAEEPVDANADATPQTTSALQPLDYQAAAAVAAAVMIAENALPLPVSLPESVLVEVTTTEQQQVQQDSPVVTSETASDLVSTTTQLQQDPQGEEEAGSQQHVRTTAPCSTCVCIHPICRHAFHAIACVAPN